MTKRAVWVMGHGRLEADAWILAADDLGLTRGDGCFEATRVVTPPPILAATSCSQPDLAAKGRGLDGRVDHLEAHLDRLESSCAALALPRPDRTAWLSVIETLVGDWELPGEAMLKLMITRGLESSPLGPTTGIVTVTPIADRVLDQRRNGVSVVTLGRGTASDAYAAAPWLLGGVKTLSYGINVAAGRFAAEQGADDVIFTSTDNYILEGPTSAVVWASGECLHTTPPGGTGILASITQRALFEAAARAGLETAYTLGSPDELNRADGVWLVSSGRGVARVHTLDGQPLRLAPGLSERIASLAGF